MEPPTTTETPRVYPIQSFLTIERLLKKLDLTPADGLQLLAEILEDLDRQIQEHEAEEQAALHLGMPVQAYGAR